MFFLLTGEQHDAERKAHSSDVDVNASADLQSVTFTEFLSVARETVGAHKFFDLSECTSTRGMFVQLCPITAYPVFKLTVDADLSWRLYYKEKLVNQNGPLLGHIPKLLDKHCFPQLLDCVNSCYVCKGHDDVPDIISHCQTNGHNFLYSIDKSTIVGYVHENTIRNTSCVLLLPNDEKKQCSNCAQFRSNLRSRATNIRVMAQKETDRVSANSKVPISKLTEAEKLERMKNLSKTVHKLQKKVRVSVSKVTRMMEKESVSVDAEQHEVMLQFLKDHSSQIEDNFPEGSSARVFWEQQVKISKLKSAKSMRWHPLIIRWCISMYSKSPSAYEQLTKAGLIRLPSKSTLKTYLNFTESVPDINPDIVEIVSKEFKCSDENVPDFKRNVVLVWDEMKIKSGLAVSSKTGKLVGFCHSDSDDTDFGAMLDKNIDSSVEVATHIMVLMVRGIMTRVNIPFIWYPCKSFTSLQLLGIVWKATRVLEYTNLKVRAWVCDGASSNRSLFKMHEQIGLDFENVTYCTRNRYDRRRFIYYICDVPHLLKTVRNNLENSHGHLNSKHLVKDQQSFKWSHIVSTVNEDKSMQLNRLVKIKEEHIHLSPQLRMRVKLASQVLSSSMANAMLARKQPELVGTAEFCSLFDQWFDCLNGRYLREGQAKIKPNLEPYKSVTDARFLWLESNFLKWLNDWENEVSSMKNLGKSEKNKLILSHQTMHGLKITTKSFVTLTKILLAEPGAQFVLPEKLNQDRLETFFGKLRRGCGDSDNPTVEQARHRILALIVAGRCFIPPKNRNCELVDDGVGMTDMLPPNRKYQRKNKLE